MARRQSMEACIMGMSKGLGRGDSEGLEAQLPFFRCAVEIRAY